MANHAQGYSGGGGGGSGGGDGGGDDGGKCGIGGSVGTAASASSPSSSSGTTESSCRASSTKYRGLGSLKSKVIHEFSCAVASHALGTAAVAGSLFVHTCKIRGSVELVSTAVVVVVVVVVVVAPSW